jgi:nicotinamide mononucleotide adenylyltransferase
MSTGVFICKCQPLTSSHIEVISQMYDDTDDHVVLISSANRASPYTYEERYTELRHIFPSIDILPLNDYESDDMWIVEVTSILHQFNDVVIYGHNRVDNEYLTWFNEYRYVEVDYIPDIMLLMRSCI